MQVWELILELQKHPRGAEVYTTAENNSYVPIAEVVVDSEGDIVVIGDPDPT